MDQRLDFDETADAVGVLNTKAQATLMYRIVAHFGPQMLRTVIRYAQLRLDIINAKEKSHDRNNKTHNGLRQSNLYKRELVGIHSVAKIPEVPAV